MKIFLNILKIKELKFFSTTCSALFEKSEHLVTGLNKDILKHINYIEPFRYTKLDTEIKSDYKSVLKINYPEF